jgi:hypothetical protein
MRSNHYPFFLALSAMLLAYMGCRQSTGTAEEADLPEVVSYNFHIRPILSDNCFACHGPDANKREAGLRLDLETEAFRVLGSGTYALVAGHPEQSVVYQRITSTDPLEVMPPPGSHLHLTEREIALIRKWIEQGAAYEPHWAFVPPKKAAISPTTLSEKWAKNEIDFFVSVKMQEKGLTPNPEADRERLLKRLSFDLTGLPPTLETMDAFLADQRPDAYERMVDQLLASPAYGEKMALYWLDVGRYADSYGYQDDNIRGQWPWRDWVIHAFNQNLPYNQFITWQLAGDMLPNATKEQILATAFNRNHKYTEEGGVIEEEYRIEYVTDKTNTFAKGILGITMECAKCHDHKYDPFSQKEYFQLFSFFNNTPEKGYEGDVNQSKMGKTPVLTITRQEIQDLLQFINPTDTAALMVSVMGELDTSRKTYVLDRGAYDAPTLEVQPETPASIMPFPQKFPKNRLGLAQWTVHPNNPLTARVFVNRMWMEFFGRGLVKTTGDFGMQGELPSHPELLDWLAVDFMENGWDIKRLVKQLVTSATYRQSAVVPADKLQKDPENIYLARAPRLRIKAEHVRDIVLASSGLLNPAIGGPSVKPYQPEGLWEAATSGRGLLAFYQQDEGKDLYRRGMYTFIKLTVPPPSLIIFDASNRDQCEVERTRTNTPLQALVMLNDPTVLEASRVLAAQLILSLPDDESRVVQAFRKILCRQPSARERGQLLQYLQSQKNHFGQAPEAALQLLQVGAYPQAALPATEVAAFMQVITALYNLEETLMKT